VEQNIIAPDLIPSGLPGFNHFRTSEKFPPPEKLPNSDGKARNSP
jgi:hypothetical protein